ncbi:MAG TPA: SpvB/TcaC N-terminal domain-containing protein, partial [Sandaracinaceae bacterium LLY-WYZ-13_1]|nr:SpvB/TcaC N-terminal domain-containing protein [Sandaracinaceae bacterium LLY-WYZ-13_1]
MEFIEVDPAQAGASVEVGVEPTTGGPSVQVPIPLTPGRDGFGPGLGLTFGGYDPLSPFPHGWSLSGLPAIDLDVRDGLPAYDGSERYRFQGQDLVPIADTTRPTEWTREGGTYEVQAFRARVESVPIRAERWTHSTSKRVHWRVRTPDGSVQIFGRRTDDESRLADPAAPERTYRWLLEAAFDRLGNAMVVRYQPEDDEDLGPAGLDATRFAGATAARHPKRILYGNATPLAEDDPTDAATWLFEAVLDYGDHGLATPQPEPSGTWAVRPDVGFTGRPGFEVRCRRMCRRVLMFHRFPTELGEPATLVGSLELDITEDPDTSTLNGVRYVGWRTEAGGRVSAPTPWATFEYTSAETEDGFEVFEAPLLGSQTRLVDLFGEGLPGLMTQDAGGVRYARNLGDGAFAPHEALPEWPTGLDGAALADFDGDGNVEWVQTTGPNAGYYRFDRRSRRWEPLRRFDTVLNLAPPSATVRQADVSGDGRPDVVLMHEGGITWFPNRGTRGFDEPIEVHLPPEKMPAANLPLDRFLADMTGDGLADIVEVLNGAVRYWPNLGRGRFGAPVFMDDAPRLDVEHAYDAARVLLLDLGSSGGADLLYLRGDGVVMRAANRRGTAFGPLEPLAYGAPIPNGVAPQVADVYGDGSQTLVWSGSSGGGAPAFHALRLVQAPGARRIARVTHPLGATTEIEWGHSVRHYLRDVESGRSWDTPLPAQRPVVDVLRRTEPIDGQEQSEQFLYHDGHYDPKERGFALFAVVDRLDVDTRAAVADVVPLLNRRFSHTGEIDYSMRFARHHYAGDLEARPPPVEDAGLLSADYYDAVRGLTGTVVREETYGTDASGLPETHPFQVTESHHSVRLTREADEQYRTGLQLIPRQTLETTYEQDPADPRQTLQRVLDVDAYLTPLVLAEAGLPRGASLARFDIQDRTLATANENGVLHIDTPERFELGIETERRAYELHVPDANDLFSETLDTDLASAIGSAQPYDQELDRTATTLTARELHQERTFYWDDPQTAALPLGEVGAVTLPHHTEESAYDRGQLASVFGTRLDPDAELPALGYVVDGDVFYARGPVTRFSDASGFYRLLETERFDTGTQAVQPDAHSLVMEQVTDEVGNTSVADVDYHVLAPRRVTDPNGTVREIDYDPLGIARRTSRYGTAMDETGAIVPHGFGALTVGQARPSFSAALANPETELGTAESLLLYEFPAAGDPMRVLSLSAEEFVDRGPGGTSNPARAVVDLSYLDGFGRVLQQRALVEPGDAWTEDPGTGELVEAPVTTRWRVSGHTVFDAKQQPVAEYEPFFRDTSDFEAALDRRQFGVATTTTYDALGRAIEQRFPNDTFTETRHTPWVQTQYDANDSSDRATDYRSVRESRPTSDPERQAVDQALRHAETPVHTHVDALGRSIATIEITEDGRELVEQSVLDIRGLSETTIDRRSREISSRAYDRLGRQLFENSADAGERRAVYDADDRETTHWRQGADAADPDTAQRFVYDLASRQTELHVDDGTTAWLAERVTYGEGQPQAADRNQLGRGVLLEDGAGQQQTPRFGAFGEPLETERTLTQTPGLDPDWSSGVALESSGHRSVSVFDALGRRARAWLPDGTERQEDYLRSGPKATVGVLTPDGVTRTILSDATYNARGQQTESILGNGVEVTSTYDAETFRLYRRRAVLPGTDPFQDLRHHYDPVGNLVYVDDLAQRPTATRVINGLTVDARREYRHDARYQLTRATGRVHEALTKPDFRGDSPTSGSFRGTRRLDLNDGTKVHRYVREYVYDAAGNLLTWHHGPESGLGNSWNNDKWVSSTSNRSYVAKDLNGIAITDPESRFDQRGQITRLPSLRAMEWSAREQLRRVVLIERTGTDDDERYDYAADGTRLRKTRRRLVDGNTETSETVNLDGCELRRVTQGSTVILERWSSHAEGEDERLATIYRWNTDTTARETDDVSAVRKHYHLGGRLGSVSLEVDGSGALLSYEEYFPYGRSAFIAGDAVRERQIKLRTLRFVGKDQDDATGFYVFQYRYYAPFL